MASLFGKTGVPEQVKRDKLKFDAKSTSDITGDTLQAGIQHGDKAKELASSLNKFNQAESTSALERALPGFKDIQANMTELLKGVSTDPFDIPEDALDFIKQQAGEAGIRGGFGGQSEFGKFNLVRNLGVESLRLGNQRIQHANNLFSTLVSKSGAINPVSPLAFLPTFSQGQSQSQFNQNTQLQVDSFNSSLKQQEEQAEANRKVKNESSILGGAMSGAMAGASVGGPWGALIGAVGGGALSASGVMDTEGVGNNASPISGAGMASFGSSFAGDDGKPIFQDRLDNFFGGSMFGGGGAETNMMNVKTGKANLPPSNPGTSIMGK